MTKTEIIKEILSIKKVDTQANLNKKTVSELQGMLDGLQEKEVVPTSQAIDIEELKRQIRAEMEAELKSKEEAPIYKKELDRNKLVPVMNVTNGVLVYISKRTGAEYSFEKYGDVEYIELQELITMRSSSKRFIDEPFLIIMDEEVVEYLNLTKLYSNLIDVDDIDRIFHQHNDKFEEILRSSPRGIQTLLVERAKQLYQEGKFDSNAKLKLINDLFDLEIGK